MRQLTEMPMTELSDTELDAVSGGFFDFGNIITQTNIGVNVALGLGSVIQQVIAQANSGNI
jgi:bacteriocin-like protein